MDKKEIKTDKLIASFGEMAYGTEAMKRSLSPADFAELTEVIAGRVPLSMHLADCVAAAMMEWAVERGATHFCHWFMPMTGLTSEKHDAFIGRGEFGAIRDFSGKNLMKGESDASSFPSGGLRAIFEARGYTAWDCTALAYVFEGSLYIPTVFCSYNGDALDQKTPLLRSIRAINSAGLRLLAALKIDGAREIVANTGAEQEYFLIDQTHYDRREDLRLTGRTLIGKQPPKGQELSDHYYGALKKRVSDFMRELDRELWKLGIYAKTRHNESAPAQHELAPVYTPLNTAADHNYMTMTVMKRVAQNHRLVCLLHEKPFAGVNGSGKHNNWSLSADNGLNFLEPGKDPKNNLLFLLTLTAVIAAVDKYAPMLRMSAASAGNDHRLGGGEAPPAVISVYIGDELTELLRGIVTGNGSAHAKKRVNLSLASLPEFAVDNADRNRTSPMAFTGNKFEFRMVGSSAALGTPNTVLNAIIAAELDEYARELENAADLHACAYEIVRTRIVRHERVLYAGNCYSEEWRAEAARRGLPDLTTTADAIAALKDESQTAVLVDTGVFTRAEIDSRYEIFLDTYVKTISIEAATLLDIVRGQVIPACNDYLRRLARTYNAVRDTGLNADLTAQSADITVISENLNTLHAWAGTLCELTKTLRGLSDLAEKARFCKEKILGAMADMRVQCDALETVVPSNGWPMPSYSDMLYS